MKAKYSKILMAAFLAVSFLFFFSPLKAQSPEEARALKEKRYAEELAKKKDSTVQEEARGKGMKKDEGAPGADRSGRGNPQKEEFVMGLVSIFKKLMDPNLKLEDLPSLLEDKGVFNTAQKIGMGEKVRQAAEKGREGERGVKEDEDLSLAWDLVKGSLKSKEKTSARESAYELKLQKSKDKLTSKLLIRAVAKVFEGADDIFHLPRNEGGQTAPAGFFGAMMNSQNPTHQPANPLPPRADEKEATPGEQK